MKVGFTGTRKGMTEEQKDALMRVLCFHGGVDGELHHGDCTGADAEANEIAGLLGWQTVVHPPLNERHRAFCGADRILPSKDYLDRNKDIVEATSILIAAPQGKEVKRSGTWSTVRFARKRGRKVIIITPEGDTA